jgi:acetoin utilization deacetylase AcuC-like enzyme
VEAANLAGEGELLEPHAATDEEILRAHDAEYLHKVKTGTLSAAEVRRIGFPWSPQMVERSRRSSGATIEACRAALVEGVAVNLAGGTHHAFRDCGEGFCVFNDSVIAARAVQAEGRAGRVAVIDCDVHQGNGTAAIARGDPTLFTFSIHGAKNFPLRKEQSDLDVELPDGAGDAAYLEALEAGLREALDRARAELVIYLAGADPHEGDRLGRMKLTKAGLAERDRLVFRHCLAADLPVAVTMAGGYGRNIDDTVDVHFRTVQLAREVLLGE